MPSAARAYDYNRADYDYIHGSAARPLPDRQERESVRVVRGRRSEEAVSPSTLRLLKTALIVLLFAAVVCCVRIAITAQTVGMLLNNDSLTAQIDEVRSASAAKEVELSSLKSPSTLKSAAGDIGMSAPSSTETLLLGEDVVVYDAEGNLSLSGSLAVAASE